MRRGWTARRRSVRVRDSERPGAYCSAVRLTADAGKHLILYGINRNRPVRFAWRRFGGVQPTTPGRGQGAGGRERTAGKAGCPGPVSPPIAGPSSGVIGQLVLSPPAWEQPAPQGPPASMPSFRTTAGFQARFLGRPRAACESRHVLLQESQGPIMLSSPVSEVLTTVNPIFPSPIPSSSPPLCLPPTRPLNGASTPFNADSMTACSMAPQPSRLAQLISDRLPLASHD